ncbi:hypothetical protein K492DRAFT_192551 [Lichtheimia hyalospora FSU 10163]|nr:hypothetical protein K492DRAFT_192551 [Lichtheimia hyalospora FSU 10163]
MKGFQLLGLALAATAVHAQCGCTSTSDPSCWTECVEQTHSCLSTCQDGNCYSGCISKHWPNGQTSDTTSAASDAASASVTASAVSESQSASASAAVSSAEVSSSGVSSAASASASSAASSISASVSASASSILPSSVLPSSFSSMLLPSSSSLAPSASQTAPGANAGTILSVSKEMLGVAVGLALFTTGLMQ